MSASCFDDADIESLRMDCPGGRQLGKYIVTNTMRSVAKLKKDQKIFVEADDKVST